MLTEHLLTKAKAYVALVGVVATALLGVYGPDDGIYQWLTVIVAVATAVGTYAVPNAEAGFDWPDLVDDDVRPHDSTPDDPDVAGTH